MGGTLLVFVAFAILVLIILVKTAVVVPQQSAIVIERLGKYAGTLNAGFHVLVPFVDVIRYRHTLKEQTIEIPAQICITRDNVQVHVDGVLYLQVLNPERASYGISSYLFAIMQLAQTTLRSVLGQVDLDGLLSDRERLNSTLQKILDQHTDPWGIKVSTVEVKDVELPQEMKRAMAKQAESERERRAVIIRAEGELSAAENLKKAMEQMSTSGAIALRTLQTIEATTANPASTVVFALPIEIIEGFKKLGNK